MTRRWLWARPGTGVQTTGSTHAPPAVQPLPASHPAVTVHPAVARIIVAERDGTSYGSGTLVDTRADFGLVITNWHVVRDATGPIEVLFPDGYRSTARALKANRDWDLAALVIWRPNVTPVTLAAMPPQPGEPLTIAGYGGGRYRMATGRCTQYVAPGIDFPYEMVEVDVAARQGDSGGPIFNQQGQLAGVLFGSGRGTTTGTYCGRIGGFLASLGPNVGRARNEVVTAAATPNRTDAAAVPIVAVASGLSANPPVRRPSAPTRTPRPRVGTVAAVPAGPTPPSQTRGCHDLTGSALLAHAKTALAVFGGLALLLRVTRRATD